MLELTHDAVLLAREADDWRQALAQAGQALARAGLVDDDYRRALFERENLASTYLGNGIAIPHGTPRAGHAIRQTGLRLLQFPHGVTWHDGHQVYLLVAIAAADDEHLDILRQLAHVLDAPDVISCLRTLDEADDLIELLTQPPVAGRLDEATIATHVPMSSREALTSVAATRLFEAGSVGAAFMGQLLAQRPTPLGHGLWLVESSTDVRQPALGVATPAVVGETVAVFVLARVESADPQDNAAMQGLLERLLAILSSRDAGNLAEYSTDQLLARLSGESSDAETLRVRVRNVHGLHARPAKLLVQLVREKRLPIKVRLEAGQAEPVSAASLTQVIGLGARRGQMLVFSARGNGARQALDDIAHAVRSGLGEDVQPLEDTSAARPSRNKLTPRPTVPTPQADTTLTAVAAAPGMAIAPVFVMRLPEFHYAETSDDSLGERRRLDGAIRQAFAALQELTRTAGDGDMAEVLSTHIEILQDSELREAAIEAINSGASAEAGWWIAIDATARTQAALADRLLAERAADLRDVGRRVLGILCGLEQPEPPEHAYILVAEDIGPSDVAQLDTTRVAGLITAQGGATSHSAILARSLGIPAVVGTGEGILTLPSGQLLIIDGNKGHITPKPNQKRRQAAQARIDQYNALAARAHRQRFQPAVTEDGASLTVTANVSNPAHTADAIERGAEGIGLLRTEFIFMAHASAPNLQTQVEEYRRAFQALEEGQTLVARTIDVGGDKPLDYLPIPPEDNPFLGLRGIRLALQRAPILEIQLRALLAAADGKPLRIMFPMIKDAEEFLQARAIYERVLAEFEAPDVQIGAMIETPASALLAHTLAPHLDFFSIGTNDLTQYTLAIDRGHPLLSSQADGLHPSVLRLIDMTIRAGHAQDCWISVCGELASDPQAVAVLLGLGADELSVNPRQVAHIKAHIRQLSQTRMARQAQDLLGLADAASVRHCLRDDKMPNETFHMPSS